MTTELRSPHICAGFTPYATSDSIELELLDGGIYTLSKDEFFTAFTFLFSADFHYFLKALNKRNELQERVMQIESTIRDAIISDECDESTTMALNDVINISNTAGYYSGITHTLRDEFADKLTWDGWINVCRMYETFTGVHRDELG